MYCIDTACHPELVASELALAHAWRQTVTTHSESQPFRCLVGATCTIMCKKLRLSSYNYNSSDYSLLGQNSVSQTQPLFTSDGCLPQVPLRSGQPQKHQIISALLCLCVYVWGVFCGSCLCVGACVWMHVCVWFVCTVRAPVCSCVFVALCVSVYSARQETF